MKFIIALSMVAFAAGYTTLDDSVSFEKLTENPDQFQKFLFCIIDKGPCPTPYDGYRAVVEEAISGACSKCTPYQKHTLYMFLTGTEKLFPQYYKELKAKYDPEGKYLPITLAIVTKYRDVDMPNFEGNHLI